MLVMVTVALTLGSETPTTSTASILWLGGQSWAGLALARLQSGGSLMFCTLMTTRSLPLLPELSVAVSSNSSVAPPGLTNGAVKLGIRVLPPDRVTLGPPIWTQV